MFPQRQQIPGFGAVAEALFCCNPRHGACERHCPFVPFLQWHRIPRFTAVAAFLLFRFLSCGIFPSFHLPKVCSFSAFSAHLPKVCNRPGSSVAPVPAFPFPAAFSHLPKVCSFSAFSAHLPKVCNRPGSSVAPVPAFPFPAASFHLPKVCSFSAFSAHLPKVCGFSAFLSHLPEVRTFRRCALEWDAGSPAVCMIFIQFSKN